jgi:predicted nucleic acid-binding protein
MILYLDTSALIKLYVDEVESQRVREQCRLAQVVATARLAYVEARAALARVKREHRIKPHDLRRAVDDFDRDWDSYFVVELTGALSQAAGELAERHALRAYDAVHLASALRLKARSEQAVALLCFDKRLQKAATAEGLP